MTLDPTKLRAAGLPQDLIKLLIETQGVVSRISSMAATVKQHLFFTESHAKTAAAARNETVGLKGQIEASAQAIAGDRAAIAQTASRVSALEAGNGQITGLRIVGNKLILDRKNAASLEVTLPGSGGTTTPLPSFTVRPSLTGSTALGGTVAVDFGVPTGADHLVGTLSRPGRAPASVADGATFVIEPADQGGTITLDVTAANSAGSVQDSAALAVPAAAVLAPTVTIPDNGGSMVVAVGPGGTDSPGASFPIPMGKTIDVLVDLTMTNSTRVILRQGPTAQIASATSTELYNRGSSSAPLRRVQRVTWTADKPFFGLTCARSNSSLVGSFTLSSMVKYRVLP